MSIIQRYHDTRTRILRKYIPSYTSSRYFLSMDPIIEEINGPVSSGYFETVTSWRTKKLVTPKPKYPKKRKGRRPYTSPDPKPKKKYPDPRKTYRVVSKDGKVSFIKVLPPNPFFVERRVVTPGDQSVVNYWTIPRSPTAYAAHGDIVGVKYNSGSSWVNGQSYKSHEDLGAVAIVNAFSDAKKAKIEKYVQMAELHESMGMLIKTGMTGANYLSATVTDIVSAAAGNALKFATLWNELWLSIRYGWLPLYLSCAEIAKAMMSPVHEGQVFDGSSNYQNESKVVPLLPLVLYDARPFVEQTQKTQQRAHCRLYVAYKRDPYPDGNGLFDISRAAWERIPFSFLVDWFIGVGNWLEAYRPGKLELDASFVTSIQEFRAETRLTRNLNIYGSNCVTTVSTAKPTKAVKTRIERSIDVSPPYVPAWEYENLKWFRQIDALALAWGPIVDLVRETFRITKKR